MRRKDRDAAELRPVKITTGVNPFAEGSCLLEAGQTRVLCIATVEPGVPKWKQEAGGGWITAEYSMLPRANRTRTPRERGSGPSGRTMEIQRLIGRSLRACVDLSALEGYTITLDCDVLQADGGTRCASITGAWVALYQALEGMVQRDQLSAMPDILPVAAVSTGLLEGSLLLDLCYEEDRDADVDLNLVMLKDKTLVEVQGTLESGRFDRQMLNRMMDLGEEGIRQLIEMQEKAAGLTD